MALSNKRARDGGGTFLTTYRDIETSVAAGNWTPNVRHALTPITMADVDAYFYRVGLVVTCAFHFVWTVNITAAAGDTIQFTLPFRRIPGSTISTYGLGVCSNWQQITPRTGYFQLGIRQVSDGNTTANFVWLGSGNVSNMRADDTNASGTKVLGGTFTYICNAADI